MDLSLNVGFELMKAAHNIRRNADNSSEIRKFKNITGSNGYIICYIADCPEKEVLQKDLEEEFSLTRSSISRTLKLMERKGLIRRLPVSYDARLKNIILTKKALEIHSIITKGIEAMEKKLIQGFTEEEIKLLLSMLYRMNSNLEG